MNLDISIHIIDCNTKKGNSKKVVMYIQTHHITKIKIYQKVKNNHKFYKILNYEFFDTNILYHCSFGYDCSYYNYH